MMTVILIITILASTQPQTTMQEHSVTYIDGALGMPVMLGIALETETGLLIGGSLERGWGFTELTPAWGISLLHSI